MGAERVRTARESWRPGESAPRRIGGVLRTLDVGTCNAHHGVGKIQDGELLELECKDLRVEGEVKATRPC